MAELLHKGEKVFRGIPVSAGVCRGKILVLGRQQHRIARHVVPDNQVLEEVNRLEKALIQTRREIVDVQHRVSEAMGAKEGSIFDAHLLVLEDRTLIDEVISVFCDNENAIMRGELKESLLDISKFKTRLKEIRDKCKEKICNCSPL